MRLTKEQLKLIEEYMRVNMGTRNEIYEFMANLTGYTSILHRGYSLIGNKEEIKLTMYRYTTPSGTLYSLHHIKRGRYTLYEFDEYGKKLFDIYE